MGQIANISTKIGSGLNKGVSQINVSVIKPGSMNQAFLQIQQNLISESNACPLINEYKNLVDGIGLQNKAKFTASSGILGLIISSSTNPVKISSRVMNSQFSAFSTCVAYQGVRGNVQKKQFSSWDGNWDFDKEAENVKRRNLKSYHQTDFRAQFIIDEIKKEFEISKPDFDYSTMKVLGIGCGTIRGKRAKDMMEAGFKSVTKKENISSSNSEGIDFVCKTFEEIKEYYNKQDLGTGELYDLVCCYESVGESQLENCISLAKPGGFIFLSQVNENPIDESYKLRSGQEDWDGMIKYDDAAKIFHKQKCFQLAITGGRCFVPNEDRWELFPYRGGNYISLFKKKNDLRFSSQAPYDVIKPGEKSNKKY